MRLIRVISKWKDLLECMNVLIYVIPNQKFSSKFIIKLAQTFGWTTDYIYAKNIKLICCCTCCEKNGKERNVHSIEQVSLPLAALERFRDQFGVICQICSAMSTAARKN